MCGLATHIHSPIWSPLIQYVLRFDRFCHSRSISTGFARLSLFIFCLLSFYTFDEYDEQSSFMGIVGLCLLDSPLSSAFFVCIFWVPLSCFDLTASLHLCRCLPSSLLHTRSHNMWTMITYLALVRSDEPHPKSVFIDCITPLEWSSICQLAGDCEQHNRQEKLSGMNEKQPQ